MAFRDLSAFLDDDALEVPVEGKVYRIASPDAEVGLYLQGLANLGEKAATGADLGPDDLDRLQLNDEDEADFIRLVLGGTLDELVADKVSWVKIQRLSRYAFFFFSTGPEAADRMLESGLLTGEAPAPNRKARRQASRAGATSTQQRASTAGTTSPRKRKPKRKGT